MTFNPTPKQKEAWILLQDNKSVEILFGGGAGGAKSYLGCKWLEIMCVQYPGSRWLLGRNELNKLKKSTLLTLFDVLRADGIKPDTHYNYNQQDGIIRFWNGSEIYLVDLKWQPSDQNYDRIGSTEYTGAFIDEVNEITKRGKEVVKSRIRYKLKEFNLKPKLLMSCNPAKNWTYMDFFKPWKEGTLPEDCAFVQALAKDNPHLDSSYLETLRNLKDKVLRERLWLGNWEYESDQNSLFHYDALTDAFTNTVDDSDKMYLVGDIARFGRDKTIFGVWKGMRLIHVEKMDISSTTDSQNKARELQARYRIPNSHTLIDEDGVGGGVVDTLGCKGFVANSRPITNDVTEAVSGYKPNYKNLRAQCYYLLADAFDKRTIRIDDNDSEVSQKIVEDLEAIKAKNVDKDAPMQIISKDEIKEHLGRSPDYGDMLMMRMYFELQSFEVNIRVL